MSLPELKENKNGLYDEILPGFIVAHPAIQGGEPTLINTRYPCYANWLWDYLDKPKKLSEFGYTREQVIAVSAFEAGRRWERNRKRRKRIEDLLLRKALEWQPK